ncbi:hypothetical protein CPSG_01212 [Coccidioides posadasii str. Silveira]|uniref:Uncharacterized protein n=1 Tax=Coccidioides posadasii (strain RMSCC 757 / Silveira) TaxID=443226 RepID=E9CRT8_COCPS|nr:hypothetical protein CPSG_01212 [Coccidioides posadasii str. Silveira]
MKIFHLASWRDSDPDGGFRAQKRRGCGRFQGAPVIGQERENLQRGSVLVGLVYLFFSLFRFALKSKALLTNIPSSNGEFPQNTLVALTHKCPV